MTLEPLLHASPAIQFHVATVVPAVILGTWQIFVSRRGTTLHRVIGYTYLTLMSVTALSTLWIHRLMPDKPFWGFSPIHLLIPLVFYGVYGALRGAWTHRIQLHRRAMIILYATAIVVTGLFTLVPGRIMNAVVFGG
ncbi:MAG TPA: DUF2306 domain-containing protein [Rhizomicrobium sp.]|nr:DUF2306 domain-containing protein [Rhizomicrobium sp.]